MDVAEDGPGLPARKNEGEMWDLVDFGFFEGSNQKGKQQHRECLAMQRRAKVIPQLAFVHCSIHRTSTQHRLGLESIMDWGPWLEFDLTFGCTVFPVKSSECRLLHSLP